MSANKQRVGYDEQKNIDECDIIKNYQGSLAKFDRKKKSGGFQSMGTNLAEDHQRKIFFVPFILFLLKDFHGKF